MKRAIRAAASVAGLVMGVAVVAPQVRAQTVEPAPPDMRVRPVPAVDLTRYQGVWYEIARYPNFYERNCTHGVTTEYTPRADGQVRIVNRCFKSDGGSDVTEGVARRASANPDTARYKVRFGPDWLAWVPWLWGNFWVIVLDPDYHYAAVGDPLRNHLWILSRTPKMDTDTYHQIIAQLRAQGFDVDKLERTSQP